MDCMMDTVEPSSTGVERSVSASAFGHEEQLELEMKQGNFSSVDLIVTDKYLDVWKSTLIHDQVV